MQNRFEKFDAAFHQEIILSSGVFRRETASGFYPWGNVVSPRKRVAEGLCALPQGCFLCFLFRCPQYLSTEPKKQAPILRAGLGLYGEWNRCVWK